MATRVDNSRNMSKDDIKNVLINTFKRSAEKSVNQAAYDRTILATVQFCSDATIGQYKIKYQNSYFTAYAQDKTVTYINGATVYVLVPGNNMQNRMFITGLATNDNSQKIYITNLDEDQQYMKNGNNMLGATGEIKLSSYPNAPREYIVPLYDKDDIENSVISIASRNQKNDILAGGGYIRFGASFKTDLLDYRKEGNYGIRLYINYEGEDKPRLYEINTFNMVGSPFNFTSFVPQYNYWEIDKNNFKEIVKIEAFAENFPTKIQSDTRASNYPDILISDITLFPATKLYDTNNDKYKVEIIAEDGYYFEEEDELSERLRFKAKLRIDGNTVEEEADKLECYWAKQDGSVNSINHTKYNQYTGKGWYCLNTSNITKKNSATSVDDIKDASSYTIESTDVTSGVGAELKWNSSVNLKLMKSVCIGRTTKLKCVIIYENVPYEAIVEVYNLSGYYLKLKTTNDETIFHNGAGYTTITAGLLKDANGAPDVSRTLGGDGYEVKYQWTEIDEAGIEKPLPQTNGQDILISCPEWDKTRDNENISQADVDSYLATLPNGAKCLERYNYYISAYNNYITLEEPDTEKADICQQRYTNIIDGRITDIEHYYVQGYENVIGNYIFGPSAVTAAYKEGENQDYVNAYIDSTTPYYYQTPNYTRVFNTLYNLRIKNIGYSATYRVTALMRAQNEVMWQSVETQEIKLINEAGSTLNYDLEIVNGDQTFLYSTGGLSPTSKNATNPITLKPLFFRLYDKHGTLVYDSVNPDSTDNKAELTELQPVWRVPIKEASLLTTSFTPGMDCCTVDPNDGGIMLVTYQANNFVYGLREKFDRNKAENSNLELQVSYGDEVIYATTHFTFSKQGDLGTNGTYMVLDIEDSAYREYKDGTLSDPSLSAFDPVGSENVNGQKKEYFYPNQRHLRNTYLYANKAYDSERELTTILNARYVNLKFAQSAGNSERTVIGSGGATLRGYWYENETKTAVDASTTKWQAGEVDIYNKGDKKYYMESSFSLSSSIGSYVTANINYLQDNPTLAYIPVGINDFVKNGVTYKYRPNNTIRVEAKAQVNEQIDPVTGQSITRTNYGYYTVPFFYFNYYQNGEGGSTSAEALDPARYIVIVDGFDEVVYDNAGYNPDYNKNPFRFFMFDKNGKDITAEVINGLSNGRTTLTWSCSEGFIGKRTIPNSIPTFASLESNDENLYGQYCTYQNKLYRCNTRYSKGQKVVFKGENDQIIEEYSAGEWVPQYWDEINILDEKPWQYSVTPVASYNSLAASALFNSWVSLTITYSALDNTNYEAQVLLPINVICNKYGSEEINGWDGKKTKVEDGFIISNKVAAGVKNRDNTFTGITMGQSFYTENASRKSEIGLFGYGHYDGNDSNPNSWARTMFIDANTGKAVFGPSGGSQIILNPTPYDGRHEVWSRIGGWYLSPNFFYKPVGEGLSLPTDKTSRNESFTRLSQSKTDLVPGAATNGSVGIYVPYYQTVTGDDVFIWATNANVDYTGNHKTNVKFYVTYGGKLHAEEAEVSGKITASSGWFGNSGTTGIKINYTDDNDNQYLLYNKNFYVKKIQGQHGEDVSVYMDGTIMARSGQFGQVGEDKTGDNSETVFIEYAWYPWHLPADTDPWDDEHFYLDRTQGRNTTYALYHKNFFIKNNGDVLFNGKLFTESGRIGDWVITKTKLKSYDGGVEVGPNQIKLGAFTASASGALTGANWYITAGGRASFTGSGNVIHYNNLVSDGTGGELWIHDHDSLKIGDNNNCALTAGVGPNSENIGMFSGMIGFNCSKIWFFNSEISASGNAKIQFGTTSGGYGTLSVDKEGLHINSRDGDFYFGANSGALYCNTLETKGMTTFNGATTFAGTNYFQGTTSVTGTFTVDFNEIYIRTGGSVVQLDQYIRDVVAAAGYATKNSFDNHIAIVLDSDGQTPHRVYEEF